MRTTLILVLLSLAGCALFKPSKTSLSDHADELPKWVYSPMEGCLESRELCASGEGPNQSIADANAFKSLAAIFETKITGMTSSFMSAQGSGAFASAQESAAVSVREEVQQTLEAARVTQRHRHQKLSYSLVVLDKAKASENLKAALEKVQAELNALWKKRDRLGWVRMWELFVQREGLNDRYNLLMGTRLPYEPTAKELQDWYQSRKSEVPLALEVVGLPAEYQDRLRARFTNAGYRVFDLKEAERVRAQFSAKQEHMNVAGFEKWFFTLTLENLSKAGAKVGGFVVSHTASGRSKIDCETKARDVLLKAMESRLTELNLKD